jgi:hypothetical protein
MTGSQVGHLGVLLLLPQRHVTQGPMLSPSAVNAGRAVGLPRASSMIFCVVGNICLPLC